jgi:hypothetical protein
VANDAINAGFDQRVPRLDGHQPAETIAEDIRLCGEISRRRCPRVLRLSPGA